MNAKNLMNRVLKTAMTSNAKLFATKVDRNGTGFVAVAMTSLPPAEFLSPGQSLPQRSAQEPEPGSRQEEVSAMRYQPKPANSTGLVGRISGPQVRRNLLAAQAAKQANRLLGTPPMDGSNRDSHSWPHCSDNRCGSDCQSLPRSTSRKGEYRGIWQTASSPARMTSPRHATNAK
jgi:hypothetical protein